LFSCLPPPPLFPSFFSSHFANTNLFC
jgi:hypothetical protein